MHLLTPGLCALLASLADANTGTGKRGLVFTPNSQYPEDNKIWNQAGSDLTWYYNYGSMPSPAFGGISQDKFEFVPMMWGLGADPNDTTWLNEVKTVMKDRNISYVLGFNEPDAPASYGGSNLDPRKAAQAWVANFEPLAKLGVKLALPACTGAPTGLVWLKQFLANCSDIVSASSSSSSSSSGGTKNCTWDVLPVHWYDNFAGLASHIGERRALWPDKEIWVTEYAYAHQDLLPTQQFYNQSIDYFTKQDYIGRYSYFGAFRAKNANVGPNAAFLNNDGKLTDIGAWYLGVHATGTKPSSGSSALPLGAAWVGAVAALAGAVLI